MSTAPLRVHVIMVAGGRGLRASGSDVAPKQFRATGKGMLLRVSLDAFLAGDPGATFQVASVALAVPDDWRERVAAAMADLEVPWGLADAGDTRTASAWQAACVLEALAHPGAEDLVAVHDAARPFATAGLLGRVAAAAAISGGAVPGVPVADTIVHSDGGPARYLHRDVLLAVQTPQVFRWQEFTAAHRWAASQRAAYTDDGGLLAACGHDPVVVAGEVENWKVTTDADWQRASALLAD